MDSREKEIIRMALIYLSANLDDAIEAFGEEDNEEAAGISVNGDIIAKPGHDEIGETIFHL